MSAALLRAVPPMERALEEWRAYRRDRWEFTVSTLPGGLRLHLPAVGRDAEIPQDPAQVAHVLERARGLAGVHHAGGPDWRVEPEALAPLVEALDVTLAWRKFMPTERDAIPAVVDILLAQGHAGWGYLSAWAQGPRGPWYASVVRNAADAHLEPQGGADIIRELVEGCGATLTDEERALGRHGRVLPVPLDRVLDAWRWLGAYHPEEWRTAVGYWAAD